MRPGRLKVRCQEFVDAVARQDAGRQRPFHALEGIGQRALAATARKMQQRAGQQARHRLRALAQFRPGWTQQQFRLELDAAVVLGIAFDEQAAHFMRRDAVGQARGDDAAGTDADVDAGVVDVEAFDRFLDGRQRADFIHRAERPAAGQHQPDAGFGGRPHALGANPGERSDSGSHDLIV